MNLFSSFEPRSMQQKGDTNAARPTMIQALQAVLHLNKKYLSAVQIPRIQETILNISYLNGIPSAKHV